MCYIVLNHTLDRQQILRGVVVWLMDCRFEAAGSISNYDHALLNFFFAKKLTRLSLSISKDREISCRKKGNVSECFVRSVPFSRSQR